MRFGSNVFMLCSIVWLWTPLLAECPSMDATGDCTVNLEDFAVFAGQWLTANTVSGSRIVSAGYPNLVRVPAGVGVVTITADDPLKTSYTVLYAECKRRGIPITLAMPSMVSSLAPTGTEENPNWTLVRATDVQIAEMVTKGGAGYLYHSNSHQQWQGFQNPAWFRNEVVFGADLGQSLPDFVGRTGTDVDREGKTPGDRISENLRAVLVYHPSSPELYISCQGFVPPGQWYDDGESDSIGLETEYWNILRSRWGSVVQMYGGRSFNSIPVNQPFCARITIADKSVPQLRSIIDTAIKTETCVHLYCHEFLTPEGSGSGKGSGSYEYSVSYTNLTAILDYIQAKVEAGKLKVYGVGGAMVAEKGTPINLLMNGDMNVASWNDPGMKPQGWARLRPSQSESCILGKRTASEMDLAHVYVDRTISEEDDRIGWYTVGEKINNCESFLLQGKVRIYSGNNVPRIIIFGGESKDCVQIKNGAHIYEAADIQDHGGVLSGLLDQPLYQYDFNGTDTKSVKITSFPMDNIQSIVNEDPGIGRCSVLATNHGLVTGDLIRFKSLIHYPGVYRVHATTTVSKVVFLSEYVPEVADDSDYIVKVNWIPFTIPFNLPKPLSRYAILLSCGDWQGTSEIDYADIVLEEAGPQVNAKGSP